MTGARIRLPYPHPGQQTIRRQAKRHNWLSAGRRWRKTTLAMSLCVEAAVRGAEVLWGAPDYDRTRIAWEETQRAAREVASFHVTERMVRFPGAGRIIFRSLNDPDSPRGHTAHGVVIDEAGEVEEAAWYESLRPMLMDTGGWSWVIGTPKGMNWFWRECMAARGGGEREDSRFWHAPSLGVRLTGEGLVREPHPLENPNLSFAELVQLSRSLPQRVFEQEVLAEFVEESGGVFRGVRAAVDAGRKENEPPKLGTPYVMGVDLARVQDWTVLTIIEERTGRQVYWERFNQISWERQVSAIAAAAKRYGARAWIDSTGIGDMPFEALRKAGVRCSAYPFTNASKENLIDALAMGLEQGKLSLMDLEVQTNELLAYQYELTPARNVRMGAPPGLHDDAVIALALAAWPLLGHRRQTGLPLE